MKPARLACLLLTFAVAAPVAGSPTRLLRQPDISAELVAFVYASDLWVAPRKGGQARRLTTSPGVESWPHFSPDGSQLAFSAEYDGNVDVYLVPVEGGEPRRLTWHPGPDVVRGFTPDGSRVIFASGRTSAPIPYPRFWSVPLDGGMPERMPVPRVFRGDLSPDGAQLAYQMVEPWENEFRNYRGGQANPIRLIDLASLEEERLPWEGSNDQCPVWLGNTVYFLSDRDLAANVWAYDLATRTLTQLTHFSDFDAKNLAGGAGKLVFEQAGRLHTLDPASGELKQLEIEARGDFPWAKPHWAKVGEALANPALSPSGKRAAFEARGEILTVPADKGDPRNLSRSPGAADRSPAWSPDGQRLAWFCDASGEYRLVIADQNGEDRKEIALENPTFYSTPVWSPDGTHISFGDADRNLWVVEVASGAARRVDNEGFAHPERLIAPAWSPDSKWLAYTRRLPNQFGAIMLYSVTDGTGSQLSDGMSDCREPVWDAGGKYLYFMASTDYGLNVGWLDMSSLDHPVTRAIYLAVLAEDEPSPLLPESDEEKGDEEKGAPDVGEAGAEKKPGSGSGKNEENKEPVTVRVDLDGVGRRVVALDLPVRDYRRLAPGEEGTLFYSEAVPLQPGLTLHRWVMKDRKGTDVLTGIQGFALSADGKKLLYGTEDDTWGIVDASASPKPGDGKLATTGLEVRVDPPAEWRQMFKEAWRFQRDYFYVDNVHGLDLDWAYANYAPWVDSVRHRSDLTYVLDILGGETSVGHSFVGGGDLPKVEGAPVGLLGADLERDSGRYRIARVYSGESWNPKLRAPLSGPGVDVKAGEYLLAVDGRELDAETNPYSLLDHTAGRQTRVRVGPKPTLDGSREVTVVPVEDETALRAQGWVEDNRRRVAELSGGRLAYVWLPDTAQGGYSNFNRYYFAQQDAKGAVVDERFNQGGMVADYVVDLLSRQLLGYFSNPVADRQPFTVPNAAIWGPKVMVINDAAGSGGDLMPYLFRAKGIGPLVGTRTWGGLVGIWDVPDLVDGGYITAPRGGFYNRQGEWEVENQGVAPDVEVEQTPKLVAAGHDPQLEKAVETALELLKAQEVRLLPQPPDPVRVARPASGHLGVRDP